MAVIIVAVVLVKNIFFQPQIPTINELLSYFQKSGFIVTSYAQPAKEQQFSDQAVQNIVHIKKQLGYNLAKDSHHSIESMPVVINGIKIYINVYQTPQIAQNIYKQNIDRQKQKKTQAQKDQLLYYPTDYLVNKNYVIHIDHWQAKVNDKFALTVIPVAINQTTLQKIQDTFMHF